MSIPIYISGYTTVTLTGYEPESLFEPSHVLSKEIAKPAALKGLAPKVDISTALSVSAVMKLKATLSPHANQEKVGIVVGSRAGNHQIAKSYADRVRKGSSSPVMYSISGYNMCAGLAALAAKFKGPSMVLSGERMNIIDCIMTASHYIQRNDADTMMVGQVDVTNQSDWGAAIFFKISKEKEPCSMEISFNPAANRLNHRIANEEKETPEHSPFLSDALRLYQFCSNNANSIEMMGSLNKEIKIFK